MYCPKCKERYEEGSRRFCPADGCRLVSGTAGASGGQSGGIFANLIPKIEGIKDLEDTLTDVPRAAAKAPADDPPRVSATPNKPAESFFDLDDQQLELLFSSEQVKSIAPVEEKSIVPIEAKSIVPVEAKSIVPVEAKSPPVVRKIDPIEIPAGHIDLGGTDPMGKAAEFDLEHPERFVRRIVKGRYRVTEFLGGDENGLSYLADDQIVADKKVLIRILSEDGYDEIISSVLAEERVSLSHFSHPNIARLIDSGQLTNGTNFLISEFVDALSVNDILQIHGQFDLARTARVIRQAASALNEAHQEGIIHRDLRPQNLIIDGSPGETETVKVVSFGASNGSPTEQNLLYKSPEVLHGRISTVASDIFSLAVVAYEMLTGQMPFDGSTAKELARSQSNGLADRASRLRPTLPASVDVILSKALSYNPADRYPKARDLGDALFAALTAPSEPVAAPANPFEGEIKQGEIKQGETALEPYVDPTPSPAVKKSTFVTVKPVAAPPTTVPTEYPPVPRNPLQKPLEAPVRRKRPVLAIVGGLILLAVLGAGWYFLVHDRTLVDRLLSSGQKDAPANSDQSALPAVATKETPPAPRNLPPPPNSTFYINNKQNLKGDLLKNFVGFAIYYPKDWKVNGPQEGKTANARGKFLDISRLTPAGRMKEQMLISYYPSQGTFDTDKVKFPEMVKETNETLKKILPGYQLVSDGEIPLNGGWRAYEIKFQGGGTSDSGEKLVVWGRRLFVPAGQPGAPNGFEITMLATSLADSVRSVDDVGVRGELAGILTSFEPNQNP